jgi:hypothetical protein
MVVVQLLIQEEVAEITKQPLPYATAAHTQSFVLNFS